MAKITANNIFVGSITSDKLDSSVASSLASVNNANTTATIASTVAAAAFTTANTLSSILANSAPIITSITISDSSYNALDDTAANTTGGYCIITGSRFISTPTVIFGTTAAPAVTYVNETTLRVQIPALTAASYPVYVVNSNGGTAIRVNGLTTSSFPAWGTAATLANTISNTAFSVALSANSDSSIIYANTTALPAGTTLAANGLFSGTVSIGTQTTYTFDVKATDVELQDATRTFSLTVTIIPLTRLWTWGYTNSGQLGQNNAVDRSSPTQVGTGTNWSLISTGQYNDIATKTDGTLWTWGWNSSGQLGQNNRIDDKSSPVQVGTGTNWSQVSTGQSSNIATKTDGTLWTWGRNDRGQLGINSRLYRSSPTQVGTGTNWSLVSIGLYSAIATKTDGTLWTWGQNNNGQLGQNNLTYRSSPVQVGTGTNWSLVSIGGQSTIATKTDGTLWTWGWNTDGQLGIGSRLSRSSPTQVGVATNWSKVSEGVYSNMATKTDGTLWTWGFNNIGQLGLNDLNSRSSPTQVGATTNWSQISFGYFNTIATKTDGTLWTWGLNNRGQLGENDTINRSSPVQVGTGTNWSLVSIGTYSTMAISTN
jgi:alpha-tubulin suppressor-like RCC1 family protein